MHLDWEKSIGNQFTNYNTRWRVQVMKLRLHFILTDLCYGVSVEMFRTWFTSQTRPSKSHGIYETVLFFQLTHLHNFYLALKNSRKASDTGSKVSKRGWRNKWMTGVWLLSNVKIKMNCKYFNSKTMKYNTYYSTFWWSNFFYTRWFR